jgi:CRP/FNR family putative post-exponential-phase nitrogen-starvation transcriptional regulator
LRFEAGETILHGMPILYLLIVVKGKAKVCTIGKKFRGCSKRHDMT